MVNSAWAPRCGCFVDVNVDSQVCHGDSVVRPPGHGPGGGSRTRMPCDGTWHETRSSVISAPLSPMPGPEGPN